MHINSNKQGFFRGGELMKRLRYVLVELQLKIDKRLNTQRKDYYV